HDASPTSDRPELDVVVAGGRMVAPGDLACACGPTAAQPQAPQLPRRSNIANSVRRLRSTVEFRRRPAPPSLRALVSTHRRSLRMRLSAHLTDLLADQLVVLITAFTDLPATRAARWLRRRLHALPTVRGLVGDGLVRGHRLPRRSRGDFGQAPAQHASQSRTEEGAQ